MVSRRLPILTLSIAHFPLPDATTHLRIVKCHPQMLW